MYFIISKSHVHFRISYAAVNSINEYVYIIRIVFISRDRVIGMIGADLIIDEISSFFVCPHLANSHFHFETNQEM